MKSGKGPRDAGPFFLPPEPVLVGDRVRLEPLAQRHLATLRRNAGDDALWQFTFHTNPFGSDASTREWYAQMSERRNALPFAVVERSSEAAIGFTRIFDVEPEHRKAEIGYTFLAKPYWRTGINRECKALLLAFLFETCGAVRVQFKAEAINRRSHAALVGLGATHEGTLRNFRIRPSDGEIRDVAIYSVLSSEWPSIKARLAGRSRDILAPE